MVPKVVVTQALEATVVASPAAWAVTRDLEAMVVVTQALEATVEVTLAQAATEGTADQVATTTRKFIGWHGLFKRMFMLATSAHKLAWSSNRTLRPR